MIQRLVLEPGWRWGEAVGAPITREWHDSPHFLYHAAGRIRFVAVDGEEVEAGPGDVVRLPPGCEAYVLGDDPVLLVDFYGALERPNNAEQG